MPGLRTPTVTVPDEVVLVRFEVLALIRLLSEPARTVTVTRGPGIEAQPDRLEDEVNLRYLTDVPVSTKSNIGQQFNIKQNGET